jgi:hypothetical protein
MELRPQARKLEEWPQAGVRSNSNFSHATNDPPEVHPLNTNII